MAPKHIVITLLLLLLIGLLPGVQAQEAAEAVITPELREQLDQLEDFTRETRELDQMGSFELVFPSRDELREFVGELLLEELTPDVVSESQAFYAAFGFLPPDFDLVATYDELYSSQIGGFYDPDTETMNVILLTGEQELGDSLPLLEQIVYVHEYVHTLQDMHFDLAAYLEALDDLSYDETLARLSLVEGDASLIMNIYTAVLAEANPFGTLAQLLLGGLQAGNLTLPPGTPAILEAELLFPYLVGEQFVRALFEEGGWEAVNAAFDDPPTTTEQILHPEKYLTREAPQSVSLTDASAQLGEGWSLMDEGRLGEFYLIEMLDLGLRTLEAEAAAAGWGGDAYHLYTSDAGLAWTLATVWDTLADADEFRAGVVASLTEQHGEPSAEDCWTTEWQVVCLSAATTLAGGPDSATALALLGE